MKCFSEEEDEEAEAENYVFWPQYLVPRTYVRTYVQFVAGRQRIRPQLPPSHRYCLAPADSCAGLLEQNRMFDVQQKLWGYIACLDSCLAAAYIACYSSSYHNRHCYCCYCDITGCAVMTVACFFPEIRSGEKGPIGRLQSNNTEEV